MRAEHHVPERQHHAKIGVSKPRIGRVMETVEFGSDHEAMQELGDPAPNVRMSHKPGDGLCDELPVDYLCRCAKPQEWEPYHHSTPECVAEVMTSSLEDMQSCASVMKRVHPPQDWRGVAQAVIAILKGVSQDNNTNNLPPGRAFARPEAEEIGEAERGEHAGQYPEEEQAHGIDGPRRVHNRMADVAPDLAVAADGPVGAIRKKLLDCEEHASQEDGYSRRHLG